MQGRPVILIAPNAFKGSLTALEAARALGRGARAALPGARTVLMPISDGGDGLMETLMSARGGGKISVWVRGPLGERRRAPLALLKGGTAAHDAERTSLSASGPRLSRVAVIEMARASGLALVPPAKRNPLKATSYGTGQLIEAALKAGARTILVGMGGSASSDGGAGMAQALGCRLLDAQGEELQPGAEALLELEHVDAASLRSRLKGVRVIAVSDVVNPLTGPRGSARVYGPQKGATPGMVRTIEKALVRYARVLKRDLGVEVAGVPGTGAAGGLGAGLFAFLGAEIVPGAEYVLKGIGAERLLRRADAAVTGEGRLDGTSFYGKAPVELARKAMRWGVPVAAVCGSLEEGVRPKLKTAGISAAATFGEVGAKSSDSMAKASHWAARASALAVKRLLLAGALLGLGLSMGKAAIVTASSQTLPLAEIDRLYFHRDQGRNLEECLARLDDFLSQDPGNPGLLWRKGRVLVRLGERRKARKERLESFKRAEEFIRKSVSLDPNEAESHFWLGVALGRRGQAQGILKSLFLVGPIRREMQAALRIDPGHGGAHHVLGEILLELPGFAGGDKRAAVKEFEEGIRLSPNYTVQYPALAEAYLALGEKQKAVQVLNRLFEVKEPLDPAEYPDNAKDAQELLKKLAP